MSGERTKSEEGQKAVAERLHDAEQRMDKSMEAFHKELTSIRVGRAAPSLVERILVDYYGSPTPLQSLAGISAPEARLLLITPYDKSAIGAIEKAIQTSELGLNPGNDGQVIRIAIPQLTEERRKEMVKQVHRKAEEGRVAVRNIRRDEVDALRRMEKDGQVSKDELETALSQVQKVTDRFVALIDELAKSKEVEVLEV